MGGGPKRGGIKRKKNGEKTALRDLGERRIPASSWGKLIDS